MKRVLVTGGSGKLGGFVTRALKHSFEVSVFDLKPPDDNYIFFKGSILNRTEIRKALVNQNIVIHLAALDAEIPASDDEFMNTNVIGSWNVFEESQNAGVEKIIYCSSTAACNVSSYNPPLFLPVNENHPCDPVSAYGLSKLLSENIARRFVALGNTSIICLRPTFIMQPENIIGIAISTAFADGTAIPDKIANLKFPENDEAIPGARSFADPRDVASAFLAAVNVTDIKWGIYNLAATNSYSLLPTIELVQKEYGIKPKIIDNEHYQKNPYASIFDTQKALQDLGWKSVYSWKEILSDAIKKHE